MRRRGAVRRLRQIPRRLSPVVRGRRGSLAAIAICSVGAGLAEALALALIAYIAATMTGATRSSFALGPLSFSASVPVLLGMAAALVIFRLCLQVVLAYVPARLSGAVQTGLRIHLIGGYLGAIWTEKARERDGHLQELMGTQASQAGIAVMMLATGLAAALELLMLVISALVLSLAVSLVLMATAGLLFAGLRPLSRRVRARAKAASAASMAQAAGVAESVRMAEELEVFGAAEGERERLVALARTLERHFVGTRSLGRLAPVIYQCAVILLLVGGLAFLNSIGPGKVAALGAIVLVLVRASAYGQQLQIAYQGFGEALPSLDRVTDALRHYEQVGRVPGHERIDSTGRLQLEGLSYRYEAEAPLVLDDVSFEIEASEAIGVIGPSGSGKSTLLQLLLRLREPTAGIYVVGGKAAARIDDEDWHRLVAFLPQEPHILSGSVAENIRFFRDWLDADAIERAARLAHIHDDITSWSDGYDTLIGHRANAVSGGQRQRVCLARALAGSPALLLLDEPTSALDVHSERMIQDSLEQLRGELTLVLVAHRMSTLAICDRVMVIRDGRLESIGPADGLYDSNDFYRRTVDLAASGRASRTD